MDKGRFLLGAAGGILLSVIGGCALMILVYLLPTDRMRDHIAETSGMLKQEGVYYQWAGGYKNAKADTYTDASLYLNAMYPGSGSPVKDAMNNPRRLYGEDNNEESAVLTATGEGEGLQGHDVNYGRYWHGSLVLLKPMLLVFDLADIRMFSMILHMGLLFMAVAGFVKRGLTPGLLGFFPAVIMLNPVTMVMCFCFSVEYILILLSAVLILYFHGLLQKGWNYYYYFLFSGICTVFFNELSFPMAVFGISLVLYLLLSEEEGWLLVKKELSLGICWGAGYGFMWMGKWLCAWVLTGYNYFAESLGQAARYTSEHATWEAENPTLWDRLYKNIHMYEKWPFAILILLAVVLMFFYILRKKHTGSRVCVQRMLPYLLAALFPFAVYAGLGNGYSYVHYWFTHRLLAVSAFAGMCMLWQGFSDTKNVSVCPKQEGMV